MPPFREGRWHTQHCAESGVWQGRWGCSQALPGVTVSLLILFTGTPGAGADSTVSRLNRHPPKPFPQKAQTSIPRPFGLFPQDLPAASEGVLILLLYQALLSPRTSYSLFAEPPSSYVNLVRINWLLHRADEQVTHHDACWSLCLKGHPPANTY